MINEEIDDPLFRKAVNAIDSGDIMLLETLLTEYPGLATDRLNYSGEKYFKDPYLIWIVADNPIRRGKLPTNILEITRLLIDYVKKNDQYNVQLQLDYTLRLIETGYTPRKCGVQIELIDLLLESGAALNGIMGAITNSNIDAAKHLIARGAEINLAGAVAFDQMEEVTNLIATASDDEKLTALTVAAFYGKPDMVAYLLNTGISPNGFPSAESGFHSHATPLHQAVSSGSMETVKLLVAAGADLRAKDKVYNGTPVDWAEYLQRQPEIEGASKQSYEIIEAYFRNIGDD